MEYYGKHLLWNLNGTGNMFHSDVKIAYETSYKLPFTRNINESKLNDIIDYIEYINEYELYNKTITLDGIIYINKMQNGGFGVYDGNHRLAAAYSKNNVYSYPY